MSEKRSGGAVGAPIWGLFLLFLGIVFLLQTFDVLPWGVWETLWRFWPVLLIIVGLAMLLRRYNAWLVSLLILVILAICLGIALWQNKLPSPLGMMTRSYSEPLGNLERAQVDIDFAAGSLTVGNLPADSMNLVEAASDVRARGDEIRTNFRREGNEGRLGLRAERIGLQTWGGNGAKWAVRFTRNIPLTLEVKAAASNLTLDLDRLKVTEIRLEIDAGNSKVNMPASAGMTNAYIKANAANLEVSIPDGVAARIDVDTNLTALHINESRFPRKGGYYISGDFETAKNRLELQIESNVGRVEVR